MIERQYDRAQELGAAATDLAGLSVLLRFVSRVPKEKRWAQLFAAKGLLHARAFPDVAEALALESVEHAPSYSGFSLLAKIAQRRGDHRARRRYQSLAAEQADAPTVRSTFIERWAVAEMKRRLRPGDTAAKRDARCATRRLLQTSREPSEREVVIGAVVEAETSATPCAKVKILA